MSCSNRFKMVVTAHVMLLQDDQILLLLRQNTDFANGMFGLVGGTADGNETVVEAAIREAKEEVGLILTESDLHFGTVMHAFSDNREIMNFFFVTHKWPGEIQNMEPHKCKEMHFFSMCNLPLNTVPYIRRAIECVFRGQVYDEFGWNRNPANDIQSNYLKGVSLIK